MKKGIIIVIVVVAVAVLQFSHFMKSQPSKVAPSEEIHFVVHQVEITPDSTYSFYDEKGNAFKSYTFETPEVINKGDIIAKEANSTALQVYRFDHNGKKEIVLQVN